eukprot:g40927.t1
MVQGPGHAPANSSGQKRPLRRQVFLGGLPGNATYEQIWQALVDAGVEIQRLRLVYHQGRSRGFAFATFASAAAARQVIANGLMVLGRKVDCRAGERQGLQRTGVYTRKLFVGNLAPSTSLQDLRDYFAAQGRVINVQLKFCAGLRPVHRGFCFVTFGEVEEAQRVLSRVHVLGGRVLRVAKAEGRAPASELPPVTSLPRAGAWRGGPTASLPHAGAWHWGPAWVTDYGVLPKQPVYALTCYAGPANGHPAPPSCCYERLFIKEDLELGVPRPRRWRRATGRTASEKGKRGERVLAQHRLCRSERERESGRGGVGRGRRKESERGWRGDNAALLFSAEQTHLRVTTNYPSLREAEAAFSASATPLDGDPLELPALGEARRALEQQGANALACSFLPRAILTSLLVAGRYAHLRGLQILVLPELAEEPCLPRRRYGAERVYECSLAEVTCSFGVVKCSLQQLAGLARTREKQEEYGFLLEHGESLLDFSRVNSLVSACRRPRVSYRPCRANALVNLFSYQRRCAEQNALASWWLARRPCAERGFRACLFTHGNFMLNRVCGCPPRNLAVYGHDLSWPAGHEQPDWRPRP